MRLIRRNWLNETSRQEQDRRLKALEEHINDLDDRLSITQNRINVIRERLGYAENDSSDTGQKRGPNDRSDSGYDQEFRGSQQDNSLD